MVSRKSLLRRTVLPAVNQDVEAHSHGETHLEGRSSYIKTMVFGGLDGILSMFAVVSGAAGASVSAKKLVCLSVGSLFASAFSMAYGEFVSSKAEADFVAVERAREEFEIRHCPEIEQREMYDIYVNRYKFTKSDAKALVELSFKKKDFFLKHMMVEELGIMLEDDDRTPFKRSLIMGSSFAVMGLFPMVGFFFLLMLGHGESDKTFITFVFTSFFSILGAAALGYFKGQYLKQNRLKSSLYMALNGLIVGLISYLFGFLLSLF